MSSIIETYVADAIRTESVPTPELLSRLSEKSRVVHAVFGLLTECGELAKPESRTNLKEEIGDCCWYVAILLDEHGIDCDTVLSSSPPTGDDVGQYDSFSVELLELLANVGRLADGFKRQIFYGKSILLQHDVFLLLKPVTQSLIKIAKINGYSMDHILAANIAKLRARYPMKFSSDAAYNRDLKAESAALSR